MSRDTRVDAVDGEEEISRAYREAGFEEIPPPHIDRAILAAARQHRQRRMTSFLPPLALAATVLLAFSIVLRIGVLETDTGPSLSEQREAQITESLSSNAELDRAGVDDTPTAQPPAESPPAPPAQGPTEPEATASRGVTVRTRAAPTPGAAFEMRQSAAALEEQDAASDGAEALGLSSTMIVGGCVAAVRSEPGAWLECISARLEEGARDAASRELQLFQDAYPDYPLPQTLRTLGQPRGGPPTC